MKFHESYLLDLLAKSKGQDRFEAHKYPVVCFNYIGKVLLIISDPEMASQLYTTKNHLTDKAGLAAEITYHMLGKSFLLWFNDASWKAKRHASAHAFYKDKLV